MSERICAGCPNVLPPTRRGGRPRKWCSDRCRKLTMYARRCIDCGKPCNVDGGVKDASDRCLKCYVEHNRHWTRERVIAAINAWADTTGGVPPTAKEWQQAHDTTLYPYESTVTDLFGSWRAGIEAAGFEGRGPGMYGRPGEEPAVRAEAARLYRSGMTGPEIAERMGVHAQTIYTWLKREGVPRRTRWTSA